MRSVGQELENAQGGRMRIDVVPVAGIGECVECAASCRNWRMRRMRRCAASCRNWRTRRVVECAVTSCGSPELENA